MATRKRTIENEGDVKAEVKKILNKHGWMWWMPPANGFGKSNVDFNALRNGVFLAIETKAKKNKCTPNQLRFLNAVSGQHGFAFVVDEHRIETLRTWCEAFDTSITATQQGQQVAPADGAAMLDAIAAMTLEMTADLAKVAAQPDEEASDE